jgi:hypothetical protein
MWRLSSELLFQDDFVARAIAFQHHVSWRKIVQQKIEETWH